ncbi:hypothetical protein OUZ56_015007 [Daphnia magna]|uniref:Uncharacterized protein n=1 Tax=Daphnia magna TaxID=35525 RepID=A0ABR0ALW8_9CRUS|nr:hypothetical protein OUZ56_015007 [Daphnia magna]
MLKQPSLFLKFHHRFRVYLVASLNSINAELSQISEILGGLRDVPDVLWWPQSHSVAERNAIVVLLLKYKISNH